MDTALHKGSRKPEKRHKSSSRSRSSSTSDAKRLKKSKKKKERERRHKKYSSGSDSCSDSSSSSENSNSSGSESEAKKSHKKKVKKHKLKNKHKKHKKLKKHDKKHSKRFRETSTKKEMSDAKNSRHPSEEDKDVIGPLPEGGSRVIAPVTKEEWEKQQSVIRKVYDPESGRNRLVKGDGEILEEIVSYERHKEINKTATAADGAHFQKQMGLSHSSS